MAPPSLDGHQKLQRQDPTRLRTRLFTPQGPFSQAVLGIFTSRFTSAENFNFTRGLYLHKDYVACREFMAWKGGRFPGGGALAVCGSGSPGQGQRCLCLPWSWGVGSCCPEADGGRLCWAGTARDTSEWRSGRGQELRSLQRVALPMAREGGC